MQCTDTPKGLIVLILSKKAMNLQTQGKHPEDFVLKVCGREEYLIGQVNILNFYYIQECLTRDVLPELVLTSVDSVPGMISSQLFLLILNSNFFSRFGKYLRNIIGNRYESARTLFDPNPSEK